MSSFVDKLRTFPRMRCAGGVDEAAIEQAEDTLGLIFSKEYREYLLELGEAKAAGREFTGICKAKRLHVVDVTQEERENVPVPEDWYVIEQANIDGIVIWQDASGSVYQTGPGTKQKKLCKSLDAFLDM